MTAILPWWKDRLEDRSPISDAFRIGINIRPIAEEPRWPQRVLRQALYFDYQSWYARYAKETYNHGVYLTNPEMVPLYASELVFFSAMSPWLYINGKLGQTRHVSVKVPELFEGRTVYVRRRKYFVKLGLWQDHVATFEQETGLKITPSVRSPKVA